MHLNNPATGSTSLSSAFAQLTELQNLTFPNGKSRKRKDVFHSERSLSGFNLMVSHALDVSSVQNLLHNKRLPPAACFVLSLRNPATRLISAFRDSFQHNERLAGSIANKRQNRSASLMIDKLRHPHSYSEWLLPDLADGKPRRNASGTAFLYANSAGKPRWFYNWHYPGPDGGSMFLTSQLNFLRGIDCAETELRIICQERFDADWRALLTTFGLDGANAKTWHSHSREVRASRSKGGKMSRTRVIAEMAVNQSMLTQEDIDFIQNQLYPWDNALHEWACRNRGGCRP